MHDYSSWGFPKARELYNGTPEQKISVKRSYEKKVEWMKENGLPIWNGEWGPVYARPQFEGKETDRINQARIKLLKDQLEIYEEDAIPWSIWLFKDITGFQGV